MQAQGVWEFNLRGPLSLREVSEHHRPWIYIQFNKSKREIEFEEKLTFFESDKYETTVRGRGFYSILGRNVLRQSEARTENSLLFAGTLVDLSIYLLRMNFVSGPQCSTFGG